MRGDRGTSAAEGKQERPEGKESPLHLEIIEFALRARSRGALRGRVQGRRRGEDGVTKAERLAAIEKARLFYYHHGRGCLLRLRDGMAADEERYSVVEEIREALAEEPDAVEIVAAAIYAVGRYDPISEAVVVESTGEAIRVLIVRADDAEDMGGVEFSATLTN
jgi:hypothetical protein